MTQLTNRNNKKPSCKKVTNCQWKLEMKTQWQDNLSMLTKIVTVSHRISEWPWRSSSQPIPFISYWQV